MFINQGLEAQPPDRSDRPVPFTGIVGAAGHQSTGAPRQWSPRWLAGLAAVIAVAGMALGWALPGRGTTSPLDPPAAPSYAEGIVVRPFSSAMPDPAVLEGRTTDYLYTGAAGFDPPNIPVRTFRNLEHLGPEVDAMPVLPPWTSGWTWAPDVRFVDGRYVMWFAAPASRDTLDTGESAKCIGVAVADSPLGPFHPGSRPVICGKWGAIDPRTFMAPDGQLWLYWKADNNAGWGPTQNPDAPGAETTVLWAQRLAPDGTTLVGPRHELLAADRSWEHKLIEAPDMVYANGRYYLFFSANPSYQDGDGIGVAICDGPAGPCNEPYRGPLLGSDTLGLGPGEESLFTQDGATWVLYSPTGTTLYRQLAVARIAFGPDGPYVATFDGAIPGIESSPPGPVEIALHSPRIR